MSVKYYDVFNNDANVLYGTDYRLAIYYSVSRTSATEASVTVKAGVSLHDWGSNGSGYPGFSSSYSWDQTVRCNGETHTESVNPTILNSEWNTLYTNTRSLPIVKYLVSKTFSVTGLSALNSKDISIGGSIQCAKSTNWSPGYGTTDFNITIPAYAGSITAGSVSISDNGNNTAKIEYTNSKVGTNNSIKSSTVYYTTDGSVPSSSNKAGSFSAGTTSQGTGSSNINIPADTDGKITIKAILITDGTYNDPSSSVASKDVKYYHKPSVRPTPKITFNTKKPTLKSNFTIKWEAGSQYGTASYNAIKGYRIRLRKTGNNNGIKFRDDCRVEPSSSDFFYEQANAGSISVDYPLTDMGIAVGEAIHATLHLWSTNGNGEILWYDWSNPAISNYVTIVNMGVVWLRIGNTWVEGQVWSRDGSTWDECTGLFIRDSSTWKESTN